METATYDLVKKILLDDGWIYYHKTDMWSTGQTFDKDTVITGVYLNYHLRDVTSICKFFTNLIKKPDLCSIVLSVLPDRYYQKVEFETCA